MYRNRASRKSFTETATAKRRKEGGSWRMLMLVESGFSEGARVRPRSGDRRENSAKRKESYRMTDHKRAMTCETAKVKGRRDNKGIS